MNRATAAAIAVAAVLGITGGTWVGATVGTDDPAAGGPGQTTSPSESRSRTRRPRDPATPFSPAQLLYMDAATINDGYTHVDVEGFDVAAVDGLIRIRGGWLVLERQEGATDYRASTVKVTGEITDLGAFSGSWDISLDGDLFTGLRGGAYVVIDLATGESLDLDVRRPEGSRPTGDVTFAGEAIITGWTDDAGIRRTFRIDLSSGRSRQVPTGTLTRWTASPGGLLIAGQVSNGAITCLRGGAMSEIDNWWTACDWALDESRPKYSPNGEQLLVVPLDPDGGPPTTYGVLATGTGVLLNTIDAPPLAMDAEWGDNNEVFVLARKSERNPASVVYRCQIGGKCVLDRPATPTRSLVLGAGV